MGTPKTDRRRGLSPSIKIGGDGLFYRHPYSAKAIGLRFNNGFSTVPRRQNHQGKSHRNQGKIKRRSVMQFIRDEIAFNKLRGR